ncbi:MAG: DPP IV N-terminal domain-containing protein [Candidatus Tectomicrobia bacterium]|uniref:DPP IV N-terminal domain-containing protein n=1 Tax=Tectimicrobiota bacterium TaxID=2528274 RepID=A0A933GL10_UNCTE|nr:DPP IV N-terminal domain-containing protein [Candidatus Tectomicrobia bacterium]
MGTIKTWKLAFVRDGNIYVSNGDGSEQKLLINNAESPSWSPDREQIAFARNNNMWVARVDGTGQGPLTFKWKKRHQDSWYRDIYISWHPRDGFITFSHEDEFRVDRLGGIKGITYKSNHPKGVVAGSSLFDVAVSGPEAKKVVVRYDLYENGTGFHFSDHSHPAWSKSGKKLDFTRNGDIVIVHPPP